MMQKFLASLKFEVISCIFSSKIDLYIKTSNALNDFALFSTERESERRAWELRDRLEYYVINLSKRILGLK